mgnify:CR=1 FL=1
MGALVLPYQGLSVFLGLVCMLGLWRMKQWAAYTDSGFAVLNQVVLALFDVWNAKALALPALVIAILVRYLPRMC